MSRQPPDFNLLDVRPHRGSQHHGFEELCAQLLSLEPRPPSAVCYRKGGSADGGVEAYVEFDNGDEHCLQAKFYRQFTADLTNKLTASLKQALDSHPRLVKYIVCLPFNLRDAKEGAKNPTELDRYKAWKEQAQVEARRRSRKLEVELWDASAIHSKLTTNDGRYAGRLRYWLDKEVFSDTWFSKRWQEAKAVLGERYLPQFHVRTPARQLIDALVRAPDFVNRLERLVGQTLEASKSLRSSLRGVLKTSGASAPGVDYLKPVADVCGTLKPANVSIEGTYDVQMWRSSAAVARKSLGDLVAWGRGAAGKSDDEHWRSFFHFTYKLSDLLAEVEEELASDKWDAANKKALFLSGPGGSGKSHLLGDAVQSILDGKRPAVLVPNSALAASPIGWNGITERLGRGGPLSVDELLGALDAAGQVADTRALLAIDAINEGPARHWWPDQLGEFLVEASRYPYVAVVFTCRDTSVNRMMGAGASSSVLTPRLARGAVEGFADKTGELSRHYLAMRGVTGWLGRPGPESTNPLFLRACCDAVIAAGSHELPKGLDGITAMFSFYKTAVARSVERRLGVVPQLHIVDRFLASFADLVAESADRYIRYEDAYALAEGVFASGALTELNLLAALEAEGLLAVEPGVGGHPDRDYVRFTFERMSDHEIARSVLKKHFERHTLAEAFDVGTPLGDALRTTGWEFESVVQALAIQVAEQHGVELGDIVPEKYGPSVWRGRENLLDSVHWRSPQSVTQRTLHWIEEAVDADGLAGFYIEFGPQVGNAFNADWLHQRLAGLNMPERDIDWSVTVTRLGFEDGGAIQSVVDWALSAGRRITDPVRIELVGTTLAWLLTTSHREVRDKATKALASVLAGSASVAVRLLSKFKSVDDGYLQERLYAAVYGAALQASWLKAEYASLATCVLRDFFGGTVSTHVLTRDYARGIVETALRARAITEAQAAAARPPYRSTWSIDLVPDEALARFVWPAGSDIEDEILSSCLRDDFEHYTIPHAIGSFGCSPRKDAATISEEQLAVQWLDHFRTWAGQQAHAALKSLLEARRDLLLAREDWARRPMLEKVAESALDRFKSEVGQLVAENLRVCTSRGDLLVLGNGYADGRARFDRLWAAKWVARHAHDLGWSAEFFEGAERSFHPTRDRMEHRIERLGKKYQWLALHDLLGRLSDGVQYIPGWSDRNPQQYEGPWQIGVRDIDPSMFRRSTKDDGWTSWSPRWWLPRQAKLTCRTPIDALQWLTSEVDVVNDEGLIDLTDSEGRRWLSLHGAVSWNRTGKHKQPHEVTRKSWVHLHCLVVRPADEGKLIAALTKSKAERHPELPDGSSYSDAFLGEYGWHPSTRGFDEWHTSDRWGQRLPRVLVPTIEYRHERGYDYSADTRVSFRMPGAWLSAGLSLRLSNGADLTWTADGKCTTFFDPAVNQDGPSAALVDRDAFFSLLEREELRAVWVLYGEKELYGPDAGVGDAFGGRLHHTSVYRNTGRNWDVVTHRFHLRPSASQLQAFMTCC